MNPIIDTEAAYALSVFGLSCLLGAVLSVFYGFFKVLRIAVKFSAVVIAIQDFVFWFLSGLAVFIFTLWQNDGIVRGYVLIGVLIGALAYYLTLGALITASATAIVGFFKRISDKIKSGVKKNFETVRQKGQAVKARRKSEKEKTRLKRSSKQAKKPKSERKRLKKTKKTLEIKTDGIV